MAADDHTDNFQGSTANEGTSTATLIRETLIWDSLLWAAQMPDDVPAAPKTLTAPEIAELYTAQYHQLVRLALLLLHDVPAAETVVQVAFEALHSTPRRLSSRHYALNFLRRRVIAESRSLQRNRKVEVMQPTPPPDKSSAEHAIMVMLQRSAVVSALRLLPVRQREAIVLRYYGDLSECPFTGFRLDGVVDSVCLGF